MPVIASVDYVNKRIFLSAETVDNDLDTLDVYREVRELRVISDAHKKFKPMIIAGGNIPKITGASFTPAYVQLLHGCRIVPYNVTHSLRLIRDTFTDDGFAGRGCFDRSPLSDTVEVDIDVDFPEIEIRKVIVGGSTGPSAVEIASAVLAAARVTPIHSDVQNRIAVADAILTRVIP